MLGKAAALAAAAAQPAAQQLSSPPAASSAAHGFLKASSQILGATNGFSAAAAADAAATAATASAVAVHNGPSGPPANAAQTSEPRRTRRDSGRFRAPGQALAAAGAAEGGRHGAIAPMQLVVDPGRQSGGGDGGGHGIGLDPRAVAEPMTPGRGGIEPRSPLRNAAPGERPDRPVSPLRAGGFTAAELRAYEATNQLLRELHFERLGRLSIRDDDEGSPSPTLQEPHHQHRRRR